MEKQSAKEYFVFKYTVHNKWVTIKTSLEDFIACVNASPASISLEAFTANLSHFETRDLSPAVGNIFPDSWKDFDLGAAKKTAVSIFHVARDKGLILAPMEGGSVLRRVGLFVMDQETKEWVMRKLETRSRTLTII
jgi:hypothetical protein